MKPFQLLPVIAMVLLIVGCSSPEDQIRQTNAALRSDHTVSATQLRTSIEIFDLVVGDCINSKINEGIEIRNIEITTCNGAWEYLVLSEFAVERNGEYPGEDYFLGESIAQCPRQYSFPIFPIRNSWRVGDRTVACVQEDYGLSDTDPKKLERLVHVISVRTGECLNEAPETNSIMIELVDCSGEWEFRAGPTYSVDNDGQYPGEEALLRELPAKCGRTYMTGLHPTPESWSLGENTVICIKDSFGLSQTDPEKLDRLVAAVSIRDGECFNEAPETDNWMVELVDCSGRWESRVLSSFRSKAAGPYPGVESLLEEAALVCEASSTSSGYPLREDWNTGPRLIFCLQDNPEQ